MAIIRTGNNRLYRISDRKKLKIRETLVIHFRLQPIPPRIMVRILTVRIRFDYGIETFPQVF